MIERLRLFLTEEKISYLIFGVLTTAVNYVSYWAVRGPLAVDYRISTVIAWILAVAFAFVTNKFFVFKSRSVRRNVLLREISSFVLARLASGVFDIGWMILAVEWIHMNDMLAKILSNVVVIIMNYILSKMFIFKSR
ncbi:MAG: GtrA family protein [Peptococcaceae bacterium]|nr:GtrA family protein [Peptococcaceae bacterium]